ncbi:MAG: hypothetical protein M3P08_15650 [Thermoproteota archaeon]|jgi:hypothetical protein|nr:hypothetical protein [Thermoproteota archaeon]
MPAAYPKISKNSLDQISTTTILDLGGENVVKLSLQLASTVKEKLDGCFDYTGPSVQVNVRMKEN